MADIKQSIIASVFSRRNATGNLDENYVSHLKIWEDAGAEGRKARYILLSQASNGTGFIHKSKLNNNGSFSVGKTWRLAELRGLQVVAPLTFNITLSRTYKWQTESPTDQSNFLVALVRLFRQITGGAVPLHLEGISDPDGSEGSYQKTPSNAGNRSQRNLQPATTQTNAAVHETSPRVPSPLPSRNGQPVPRAGSPANSTRELSSSVRSRETPLKAPPSTPGRPRKGSDAVSLPPPQALRPRRPSNAQPPPQVPTLHLPSSSMGSRGYDVDGDGSSTRSRKDSQQSTNNRTGPLSNTLAPATRSRGPSPEPRSRKMSATRENGPTRGKDPNARLSYFDPANQQRLDRLIVGGAQSDADAGVNGHLDGEAGDEVESAQDTLASVEEMIEGYEWATDDVIGRKMARGAADMIEARLLDELMALEKANIHSFLESDDRINLVMKFMDDALAELDNLDGLISSYKIHLNAADDDVLYIQSQNRGLQVQTQNQRALLNEIENLLQTVQVDSDALITLTQESLEKSQSISRLEQAAAELYKALQAGRDTDMAATMERLQEYRTHNSQFCKRMHDFLTIMFTAQSKLLLGETSGLTKAKKGTRPVIIQHQDIEEYLGRYCGLMLYLKEMDEAVYGRLCAAHFSAASELHSTQIKALMSIYLGYVKRASEEEGEHVFSSNPTSPMPKASSGMRRAGTLIRSPMELRNKDKDKSGSASSSSDGDMRVSEVFALILDQIIPLIYQESNFLADFLQINSLNHDTALTFADYMALDHYFRRQAARENNLSPTTIKLLRGAMELIFGFLPTEVKAWVEKALEKDPIEIVGVLATLERFMMEADEKGNQFLIGFLGKQHTRLKGVFDRHINDQLKNIEHTKSTSKKRKGVVPFIKHFPQYTHRLEDQLIAVDADGLGLEVRESVDMAYEKIVNAMFETLKAIAKMGGDEEDKSQLNYHVVLIENMHHFVSETARMEVGSVGGFTKKARGIYDENLSAYVKIIFRRPFGKIIDYFEGLERLLRTLSSPTEITTNSTYSKNALRKITREYTIKDLRKLIDGLYKIVQKHFIDSAAAVSAATTAAPGSGGTMNGQDGDRVTATEESVGRTVLLGVWKHCEEELVKLTEGWKERVSQCYGDAGGLEFGIGDIESAFRKHK